MSDFITVRKFSEKDLKSLKKFYHLAYGQRAIYKFPERWEWIYKASDHVSPDLGAPFYLAFSGGAIVGHCGAIRVPCKLFDRVLTLGWGIDSFVIEEFRGKGIGKKLQTIYLQDHEVVASVALTPLNRRIKTDLGAVEGPVVRLFCKVLSMHGQKDALRERFGKLYGFIWVLTLIFRRLRSFHCSLSFNLIERFNPDIGVKVTEHRPAFFGKEEDELWESVRSRYDFAVERYSDYLNWRYRDQPWTKHYVIRAYDDQKRLQGLAVFRLADEAVEKGGVILEVYDRNNSETIIGQLLEACEQSILDMGGSLVQCASSCALMSKIALERGYLLAEARPLIINGSDPDIYCISSKSSVLISKGDQDWDQYPRFRFFDLPTLYFRACTLRRQFKRPKLLRN